MTQPQSKKKKNTTKKKALKNRTPKPSLHSAEAEISNSKPTGFPIVGVGASAGGLDPICTLFHSMSTQPGMAFVVIQHLDPDAKSSLPEIIAGITKLPVLTVQDGVKVERNKVYILPPKKCVVMRDGHLSLLPRQPDVRGINLPIDVFLSSLAEQEGSSAIGVILSGFGSDGARGVKAIHAEGGLTFAQDSESSKFDSMPTSAVSTGCIDFILPPNQIATELERIGRHPALAPEAGAHAAVEPSKPEPEDEQDLRSIFSLLMKSGGVNFTDYKEPTIRRRIQRRMILLKLDTLHQYTQFLESDPHELDALYNDVLIKVTNFFRDPEVFEALQKSIIPKVLDTVDAQSPLRVWVAACSTGQEAYSLAMAIIECLPPKQANREIQIFATDVCPDSIRIARAAVYGIEIETEVSAERLERFFDKTDKGYRIKKFVRDVCVFAHHNLITDPPFSGLDLVSCRNVLIYLNQPTQKRVFPVFHYALKPSGYLLVGKSETAGVASEFFKIVDSKNKIYSRNPAKSAHFFSTPVEFFEKNIRTSQQPTNRLETYDESTIIKEADRLILSKLAPAGFVVNADMDIIQIRGDTNDYCTFSSGLPSFNLMKIVREELALPLRHLIRSVAKSGVGATRENVSILLNKKPVVLRIQVSPLHSYAAFRKHYVIVISKQFAASGVGAKGKKKKVNVVEQSQVELGEIEYELGEAKAQLRSVIEQFETTNEELKSSNEEIISSNEELQSTNEELQTAKEETQSANEELTTLNEELQRRNSEMGVVNDDLLNLLSSTRIPIIMLDRDLNIRRYTPQASKLFKIVATDIGRQIGDIKASFDTNLLEKTAREVIDSVQARDKEIIDEQGRFFWMHIRPYRTSDNRIDGVVFTFLDLTQKKKVENQLRDSEQMFREMFDGAPFGIAIIDDTKRFVRVNEALAAMFGYSQRELLALSVGELSLREESTQADERLKRLFSGELDDFSIEKQYMRKNGTSFWASVVASTVRSPDGKVVYALGMIQDIEERRQLRDTLQSIVEAAPNAIVVADATGGLKFVNSEAEQLFGYQDDELIGSHWDRLVPEEKRTAYREYSLAYLSHPVVQTLGLTESLYVITKGGHKIPVEVSLSPITTAKGVLVVASIRDISARLEGERRLTADKVAAEQSNDQKSSFLAQISHELRTPLTAIVGFSEILANHPTSDAERDEYTDRIRQAAVHLKDLVDDILDLSKVEAGKIDIEMVDVCLSELIHDVMIYLKESAEKKGISLVVEVEPDVPSNINSDPTRLRQLFSNIIGNAIKFTSEGSVRVRISGRFTDLPTLIQLRILVEDSGCGISAEHLEHLFQPFSQATSSTKRKFGGTGLGLVLCQKIAKAMGGDVKLLRSEPEVGSTFEITVNVTVAQQNGTDSVAGQPAKVLPLSSVRFANACVLVVEDNNELQVMAKKMLTMLGAEVEVVANGVGAVKMAMGKSYTLILLDIQLPDLSGYEVTEKLRKSGYKGPIVALTAGLTESDVDKHRAVGFNESVNKPYTFEQLTQLLEKYAPK